MKILQVCNIDTAVAAFLKPLHSMFMQQDYTVHYACTQTGSLFKELQNEGLYMIHIPIHRRIYSLQNIKSIGQLAVLMKNERYDVVHVHTPIAAILGRIAAKLVRVKHVIYTAHGFYFHEHMSKLNYLFYYHIEKYFARYFTDTLHLVSREDYDLCITNQFRPKKHLVHIQNGVDLRFRFSEELINCTKKESLRKELFIQPNDIVFTFVGRLVREKGILELLEAFQHLKQECRRVKLLIIGELSTSERDQKSYRKIEKDIQNDTSIIAPGYRKDIPELLSISDVFILPSYREGLPLSIIEAMAMKKPIIATNIRGCREEVMHGKNGFLVEVGNPEELYQRMYELTVNHNLRSEFGQNSRKIAEKYFDKEEVLSKLLQLYHQIEKDQ
ncbi:glycosyltransferase family 4 protein [Thermoflavimicrobium daqui]|jgi:glycosyltransferase involved in cell wall biosynthesis|nr:glycosyltransferase family 4 protein [Thermoflavimicrobium daqui]